MTHLSDFSYLERAVLDVYISVYLLYSIWQNDRFRCLHPSKVFGGELRSIITVIMLIMMTTQAIWDYFGTYIKYTEGFMMLPTGQIIQKPYAFWSPDHQKAVQPMDYLECVTFAFQTSVFFLLQCFWNYLSNTIAKKSFMGSFEFKFYIFWALGSMAMFPVLQWRYRNDELMSEIVPQLAYGIEVLITAALGVRSNFRFKRVIAYARRNKSNPIANRLAYFKEMNIMLTVVLFSYGASFVILCADGLTNRQIINTDKFACDLMIANANMCVICLWLLYISIFHPRRGISQANSNNNTSSLATKSGQDSNFASKNDVEMTTQVANTVKRFSQRITSFMNHEKHLVSSPTEPNNNNNKNNIFLRTMSPVTVDYPPSVTGTETAPLTATAAPFQRGRNVSIEDPYSHQSIVFSMVDRPKYPTPIIGPVPPPPPQPARQYKNDNDDVHSEYDVDVSGYHDDTATTAPQERPPPPPAPGHERMVTDWLYQSPERK